MIAENVRGTLYGSIADGLYSAYVSSSVISNRSAYVVTRKRIKEFFDGVVVAVAEFEGMSGERLIIAQPGEIFYEPELRDRLSKLRNVKVKSMRCLYEKSCGGIIFYKTKQNTKILLVKNNNGRYWSFPKGHIEQGETEQETAIREIKEETGLDVTLVNNFREISEYCPFGKIRKRVVFFLARAFTDNVKIQEEEIDSFIWVDLQQARKLCSYDNDLRIIDKAETTIHLMRN
ncbi:bis(5'-nucleosyl)-tetraphosphatase [Roseburia sp. MSJ-14]|uniref:bis(5'-nucleosyl)-tetraphosphatase n=1 Tax=Roseburia sp. MSJ-14 TaxID=2841514 RepID=UPI0020A031FB|nr:NUDIX domain-containing protein [Roseburia sp. MSJ-14]